MSAASALQLGRTLVCMANLWNVVQIGVIVLISISVLASLVAVWRDDHKLVDDHTWGPR